MAIYTTIINIPPVPPALSVNKIEFICLPPSLLESHAIKSSLRSGVAYVLQSFHRKLYTTRNIVNKSNAFTINLY